MSKIIDSKDLLLSEDLEILLKHCDPNEPLIIDPSLKDIFPEETLKEFFPKLKYMKIRDIKLEENK